MKVYISADIEGVTGVISWSQAGRPRADHYDFAFARRMMTHDVNAAIRGAAQAGATEIVVKDSHGNSKNLLVDELESPVPVTLVSGHGAGREENQCDGMMTGIDETFAAAVLVGYHGMAGTMRGIMEHTITGGIHRMWLTDSHGGEKLAGEIALAAGLAGNYGVPTVAVSSDLAGCAEARALIPEASTAVVKEGYGRYMGAVKHPSQTSLLIEAAVAQGVANRELIPPVSFGEQVTIRVEFNRAEEADQCVKLTPYQRSDAYTVSAAFSTFWEAHRAAWLLTALSGVGIDSQH